VSPQWWGWPFGIILYRFVSFLSESGYSGLKDEQDGGFIFVPKCCHKNEIGEIATI
jgi:hypothetical protein